MPPRTACRKTMRAAGPGKVPEAGRESGRSGFGALKRRPAHDPATARLPTHASRSPPTHPETPHSYARRPKAAACAADASRSHHRLPKHRCSGSSRERTTLACGPLSAPVPDSCHLTPPSKPAGGSLLPSPRPLQRAAQQRHHRWLYTVSAFHQSHSSSIMSDVGAQGLDSIDQLGDNSRAWGSSGTGCDGAWCPAECTQGQECTASRPRAHGTTPSVRWLHPCTQRGQGGELLAAPKRFDSGLGW
eukprot:COSAG03_NODE_4744_length_1446_cov_4.482554_2_plen_246_part_00